MNIIRRKKLIAGLKRPKAFLNAIFQVLLSRRLIFNPFTPINVQIEPTSRCNLKCLTCSRSTYTDDMIGDMSFNDFRKIIDQLPNVLFVKIQGMGEPYLNREIVSMLKYCKDKGMITEIISNGTVFDEKSLDYLDSLIFSFDGGTKETFEFLRPGLRFENVIDNIKEAVKLKDQTTIQLSIVVSNVNNNELIEFVNIARDLMVDGVYFCPVEQWVVDKNSKREQISNFIIENHQKIVDAVNYADKVGLFCSYNNNRDWVKACRWPWQGTFITHDGFLTPCCIRPDKRVMNFGNIFNEPFAEIWNNEKYKNIRRSLKANKPMQICRNCPN